MIHVDQAAFFFVDQVFEGLRDLHLFLTRTIAEQARQNVFQVDVGFFAALHTDDLKVRLVAIPRVDLDDAVVQFALTELLAQLFAGAVLRFRLLSLWLGRCIEVDSDGQRHALRLVTGLRLLCGLHRLGRCGRQQQIEQPLFGAHLGLVFHLFQLLFTHHLDGGLDQVTHDALDITADVAHLGELAGLHLQERRIG